MPSTEDDKKTINPLQGTLDYELRRASVAVMNALSKELEPIGLRPSEASLIALIGANPGRTQSAIALLTKAQPANMVPLINSLMKSGIVERKSAGGRALALYLTKDGERLLKDVNKALASHEKKIGKHLNKADLQALNETLRTICTDACHSHK